MWPRRRLDGRRVGHAATTVIGRCRNRLDSALCEDPAAMGTTDARRALLARLIDHAPTFPPASLVAVRGAGRGRSRGARARMRSCSPGWYGPRRALAELSSTGARVSAVLDAPLPEDAHVEAVEARPSATGTGSRRPSRPRSTSRRRSTTGSRIDSTASRSMGSARRSGAVGTSVPGEAELARFVGGVPRARLVFKATAGLHHAVRGNGEHGFLNLLAAAVFEGDEEGGARGDRARRVRARRRGVLVARPLGVGRRARARAARALPLDRELQLLRAGRGARGARDAAAVKGAVGFGVFSVGDGTPRVGFRVGEGILDLAAAGLGAVFEAGSLNPFLALGRSSWEDTVARVEELVHGGRRARAARGRARRICRSRSPTTSTSTRRSSTRRTSGGSSAPTPSRCFRTGATPVGYHGRAGTVVVSGTPVVRPSGQVKAPAGGRAAIRAEPAARHRARARVRRRASGAASASPCRRRRSATTSSAWCSSTTGARATSRRGSTSRSGPFLGKSFATSIAAWVTPLVAARGPLRRVAAAGSRAASVPARRPATGRSTSSSRSSSPAPWSRVTNARGLYWTMPQQLAHATVNGASIRTGDLFASGTISGAGSRLARDR